jgi:hypothetical protein
MRKRLRQFTPPKKEQMARLWLLPGPAGVVGVASDPTSLMLALSFAIGFFTASLLYTVSTILLRAQINFSFCFFQQFS